ncbi:MAG: bifunctional [glutamate--ammonia ligase]-adenylyl-L-tyrosine phosphorylase/[glutamate--ammonia-ligase] adenylyltransferase [Xanthomonadales bacterium]|nr:bifunctional [glutamate--ammonia ligase]-adenylyl-L-tyrosine phosphorylase/[glutamate--ammonia-ligase] adenylyltransferase [Xanthomonadales bacterium]
MSVQLPGALADLVGQRLAALAGAGPPPPWLPRLLLASDFAWDVLREDAGRLAELVARVDDLGDPATRWPGAGSDAARALRRFRRMESVRLVVRDLTGADDVRATLDGASALADCALDVALALAVERVAARHGRCRDGQGEAIAPVLFALGKLGGGELNFSSDVDLVFAYRGGGGDSDGARSLAPDAWQARVVRETAALLGEITPDGFVFRVDLRLRPFGQSGKPALPFPAMEQYFQREGRDWERYAWLKARPVAGDRAAGAEFLDMLRPFVYRRYLDYPAIDALREMKAQIDLEVQRQDLSDDIKLGPGGIREIEFLVQVVQLVRGGRDPTLRQRGLLTALAACAEAGYIAPATATMLRDAYLFLRRLENRLQMLRDAQTQALPESDVDRLRIALALDFPDWSALAAVLAGHRERVAGEFAQVLAPRARAGGDAPAAMLALWRALAEDRAGPAQIGAAGLSIGDALHDRLRALARSPGVQALSARARDRLDRLMATLLERLRGAPGQDEEAAAIVELLHVLLRRSNYLALLAQQPRALERLFALARGSRGLLRRLVEQPLLLDDVFDPRAPAPPAGEEIAQELVRAATGAGGDPEAVLAALAEARTSLHFRLGLAAVDGTLPAASIAAGLAAIARGVLAQVLHLALADTVRSHGWPTGGGPARCGLTLVGYGSVGAGELGFASDLDLVFVFDDALGAAETAGPRPIEGQRFYARVVQKLIAFLAVPLPGGRLYEIDARLRPDGAKGLLVTSLDGYAAYIRERAWTWEQQALVRSSVVAGDTALAARFEALRAAALGQTRDIPALRAAVAAMRARLRAQLDRSAPGRFDLKQGTGGLVDLEFLLQFLVLAHGHAHTALLAGRGSAELLVALRDAGVLDPATVLALLQSHAELLSRALVRTLDERPRVVPPDAVLDAARLPVTAAWQAWLGEPDGAHPGGAPAETAP